MDAIQQTLLQYGALGVMAVLLIGTVIYQAKQGVAKDKTISDLWQARLDDARISKAANDQTLTVMATVSAALDALRHSMEARPRGRA